MSFLLGFYNSLAGGCSFDSVFTEEIRRRAARAPIVITDTAYTLKATDTGADLFFSNLNPVTVTVPAGLSDTFKCQIWQDSTGQVSIANGAGASLNAYSGWKKTAGQWAGATLVHRGNDVYALAGQLTA